MEITKLQNIEKMIENLSVYYYDVSSKYQDLIQRNLKASEQRVKDNRRNKDLPRESQELEARIRAANRANTNFDSEIAQISRLIQAEKTELSNKLAGSDFRIEIEEFVQRILNTESRLCAEVLQIDEICNNLTAEAHQRISALFEKAQNEFAKHIFDMALYSCKTVEEMQDKIQRMNAIKSSSVLEPEILDCKQKIQLIQKDLKKFTESSEKVLFLMKKNARISLDMLPQELLVRSKLAANQSGMATKSSLNSSMDTHTEYVKHVSTSINENISLINQLTEASDEFSFGTKHNLIELQVKLDSVIEGPKHQEASMKGVPSFRETELDLKSPDNQKNSFSMTSRPPRLQSPNARVDSNPFSKTFSGSFRNNFPPKASTPQSVSSKNFFGNRFASPSGVLRGEQRRHRDSSRGSLTSEKSPVREEPHSSSSVSHRIKLLRSAVKGLIASSNKLLKCTNPNAPGYLFITELYEKDKRYVETVFKELIDSSPEIFSFRSLSPKYSRGNSPSSAANRYIGPKIGLVQSPRTYSAMDPHEAAYISQNEKTQRQESQVDNITEQQASSEPKLHRKVNSQGDSENREFMYKNELKRPSRKPEDDDPRKSPKKDIASHEISYGLRATKQEENQSLNSEEVSKSTFDSLKRKYEELKKEYANLEMHYKGKTVQNTTFSQKLAEISSSYAQALADKNKFEEMCKKTQKKADERKKDLKQLFELLKAKEKELHNMQDLLSNTPRTLLGNSVDFSREQEKEMKIKELETKVQSKEGDLKMMQDNVQRLMRSIETEKQLEGKSNIDLGASRTKSGSINMNVIAEDTADAESGIADQLNFNEREGSVANALSRQQKFENTRQESSNQLISALDERSKKFDDFLRKEISPSAKLTQQEMRKNIVTLTAEQIGSIKNTPFNIENFEKFKDLMIRKDVQIENLDSQLQDSLKKYQELLSDARAYQESKAKRENEQKDKIKMLTSKLRELKDFAKTLAKDDLKNSGALKEVEQIVDVMCKEAGARSNEIKEIGLKKKLGILRDILSAMKKEFFKKSQKDSTGNHSDKEKLESQEAEKRLLQEQVLRLKEQVESSKNLTSRQLEEQKQTPNRAKDLLECEMGLCGVIQKFFVADFSSQGLNWRDHLTLLDEKLEGFSSELLELRNQNYSNNLSEQSPDKISQLKAQITELSKSKSQLEEEGQKQKAALNGLENQIRALDIENKALRTQALDLHSQNKKLAQEKSRLEQERTASDQNLELKSQILSLNSQLTGLREENISFKQSTQSLEKEIQTLKFQNSDIAAKLLAGKEIVNKLEAERKNSEKIETKIQDLKVELKKQKENNTKLQEDNQKFSKAIQNSNTQNEGLKTQIRLLEEQLKGGAQKDQTSFEISRAEFEELRAALSSRDIDLQQSAAKIQEYEKEISELCKQNMDYKGKIKDKDLVLGQVVDLIRESLEKIKPQSSAKSKEKKITFEYIKKELDVLFEAYEDRIAESRREIETETKRQLIERDEELNEIKKHISEFEEIQRKQIDQKDLLLKSLQQKLEKQVIDYANIETDRSRLETQTIGLNKIIESQQKKIEELKTGIDNEAQRFENHSNENVSLKKSLDQLEFQLSSAKRENDNLRLANDELRSNFQQTNSEKADLQSELEDRKQEYNQLSERLKWAAETSDQYVSQLNLLKETIAVKDREITALNKNIQNITKNESDLQKITGTSGEEIKKLKAIIQELENNLESQEAEKTAFSEQIKALEARLRESENFLHQTKENEREAIRKHETLNQDRIKTEKEAEKVAKEFQSQIENLKKQFDQNRVALTEQLQTAQAQIEDYARSIKNFENLLLEKDDLLSENISKKASFEKKLGETDSINQKLNEEISTLETKNSELKRKINELESTQKASAMEKENNTSSLTEKEKSWSQEHARLQLALQSTQDERDKAIEQLNKQFKTNANLTSEIQSLNSAIELHSQDIRVLKSSLTTKDQELKSLQEEIVALKKIKETEEASMTRKYETKVNEMHTLLEIKQKLIEELEIKVEASSKRSENLAKESENFEKQLSNAHKENRVLQQTNLEIKKNLENVNSERDQLKSELEERKKEFDQLCERFKLAMAINEQTGLQINELKEEIITKSEEAAQLKDSLQKLTQSESRLQGEAEGFKNVIKSLNNKIEQIESTLSQVKLGEQDLQNENDRLKKDYEKQIENLKLEFQNLHSLLELKIHNLAQRDSEISELKSTKQTLEKNLEDSTALAQKSLEDLKGINEKFISLRKEFDAVKKDRDILTTKNSTLAATLETSNQEIMRLIQENTSLKEEASRKDSQKLTEVETLKEQVARLENDIKEANFSKEKMEKALNSKVETLTTAKAELEQKIHLKETELFELKEDKEVFRRELKAKEEARASSQNEKEQLIKALKQQQEERKYDLDGLAKDKDSVIESLNRKLISLQQEFVDYQQQKDLEKSKNQSSIKQALVDKDQELLAVKKKLREMEEAAYNKFNQYESLLREVEKELKDEKIHSDDLSKEILKHEKIKAAIFDELFDIIQEKGLLELVPEEKLESPKEEALIDITRIVMAKLLETQEQFSDEKAKLEKELNFAKKKTEELEEQAKPLEEARERALLSLKDEKSRVEKLERERGELQNKLDETRLNVEQRETTIKQKNAIIESQEKTILQLQEELRGWEERLSKVLSTGSEKQGIGALENDSGTAKKLILKIDTIIHSVIFELDPTAAINDDMRIISAEDDVQKCERILFFKLKSIIENYKSSFDWKIKYEKLLKEYQEKQDEIINLKVEVDRLGKINDELAGEHDNLKEKVLEIENNQHFEIGELKKSRSSKTDIDLDHKAIDEDQLRAFLNESSIHEARVDSSVRVPNLGLELKMIQEEMKDSILRLKN